PEYADLLTSKRNYEKAKSELIQRISQDMRARSLTADDVIEQIFSSAKNLVVSSAILEKAETRRAVGNPPGKRSDPIGDEINWELLLHEFTRTPSPLSPTDNDLHIISNDRDWESGFQDESPNHFLCMEW